MVVHTASNDNTIHTRSSPLILLLFCASVLGYVKTLQVCAFYIIPTRNLIDFNRKAIPSITNWCIKSFEERITWNSNSILTRYCSKSRDPSIAPSKHMDPKYILDQRQNQPLSSLFPSLQNFKRGALGFTYSMLVPSFLHRPILSSPSFPLTWGQLLSTPSSFTPSPPWSAHCTAVAPSPSCSSSFSFSLIWTTVALTKDGFMSCHRPPLESLWSTHNSSTIHTEKLSGVIKIFALTEGAAMLIAEAEYFMVRDVNSGQPANQPTNHHSQCPIDVRSHQPTPSLSSLSCPN